MNDIVMYALGFATVIVVVVISGAVAVLANNQVTATLSDMNVTAPSWYTSTVTNAGNALSTFGGFLPILAIAIVGGLAMFYVMNFMNRR